MALTFPVPGRRAPSFGRCGVLALALGFGAALAGGAFAGQPPANETPAEFKPHVDTFDYTRRDVMIPMRDGVKLKTLILIPRGVEHAPILLTRTPYGATERIEQRASAHLSEVIGNTDVADDAVIHGGYIRVMQDVRGKHDSEGDYAMTRPLRGPLNPTDVDHATDTYDTIDWLVKNIPESNGKVGILGISYDGFTSLMALVNPHPALRAAVPINAMVDGWVGDDWFHKGAFRQNSLIYFHDQEATRGEHLALVVGSLRRLRYLAVGRIRGRHGASSRTRSSGLCRKGDEPPRVRFVLAGSSARQGSRGPRRHGTDHAGSQPVGPGRHLRQHRALQGPRVAARRSLQPIPGVGPLVSPSGAAGWQPRRGNRIRERYRAIFPPPHPAAVPRSLSQGRRAAARCRARQRLRDRHEPLAPARALALRVRGKLQHRRPKNCIFEPAADSTRRPPRTRISNRTFPIPRSRFPTCRAPSTRQDPTERAHGRRGW